MAQEPVTIFISRRFKPNVREAAEAWTREVRQASSRYPGFLGAVTLEPHRKDENTYQVVFRFASFQDLCRWEESADRAELYQKLQPLLEEEHSSRLTGYEPWFPPGDLNHPLPPPKWKMCVMALLAVFPTVLLVQILLGPSLAHIPLVPRVFIGCIPVSILMSYLSMPGLTRLFRRWLYPAKF